MTDELWTVIYSNYFPREVDSWWDTEAEAIAQRDSLNEESKATGPSGSDAWEVERVR